MWGHTLEPELDRIFRILRSHPLGLTEYELLEALRGESPVRGLSELELFRVHFLLFHHLYRLRAALEAEGLATVDVHCLRVQLRPKPVSHGGEGLPLAPDPLAAYYLDLENLAQTTAEDVHDLLRTFWQRFRVHGRREEALSVLGLGAKASRSEIRRRFRELSLRHHPDRGGDSEDFARLVEAMSVLRTLGLASAA